MSLSSVCVVYPRVLLLQHGDPPGASGHRVSSWGWDILVSVRVRRGFCSVLRKDGCWEAHPWAEWAENGNFALQVCWCCDNVACFAEGYAKMQRLPFPSYSSHCFRPWHVTLCGTVVLGVTGLKQIHIVQTFYPKKKNLRTQSLLQTQGQTESQSGYPGSWNND